MISLGKYLREVRNRRGFSLKFVCENTGIKDSTLSRIERERNKSIPSAEILQKLAKLYSISLVDLYYVTGYLNEQDISVYKHTFRNVDLLTEEEKIHIQEEIDLFAKGRDAS